MENASKALIMAGAILIAILVISLGVYVYNNYSETVESQANMEEEEMEAFNNQVIGYLGNKISGSQVNALIQTVRSINQTAITDSPSNPSPIISIEYRDSDTDSYTTIMEVTLESDGSYSVSSTKSRVDTGSTTYTVEETYENRLNWENINNEKFDNNIAQ